LNFDHVGAFHRNPSVSNGCATVKFFRFGLKTGKKPAENGNYTTHLGVGPTGGRGLTGKNAVCWDKISSKRMAGY
jgi:hypothetical protein